MAKIDQKRTPIVIAAEDEVSEAAKVGPAFLMERDLVVNPKLQLDIFDETGVGVQGFQIGARDFKNGFGIGFDPETDSGSEVITAQRGLDIPFQEITHAANAPVALKYLPRKWWLRSKPARHFSQTET